MKTYLEMTPRGRLSWLTRYQSTPDRAMLRAMLGSHYPNKTPSHTNRIFHLEAGHGLRVVPADGIIRLDHRGWFIDQFQDETTQAHVIRLPKGRGFLCAASDPWNPDAYTVLNDAPEPCKPGGSDSQRGDADAHDAEREAARQAEQFTERLSEDYRDDAEHQTALMQYEDALHPLEEAKRGAEARRDEAERKAGILAQWLSRHPPETLPDPKKPFAFCTHEEVRALAQKQWRELKAKQEAERDAAQDDANDIQDQIDNLEEPAAPNFYYFGKAKR